jgi:hypothetical protein
MADNLRFRRKNRHRSKWNTGFHICGKSQRDRKEILRKAGKYSDHGNKTSDGFFRELYHWTGTRWTWRIFNVTPRQNWRRIWLIWKTLATLNGDLIHSKTIPEGVFIEFQSYVSNTDGSGKLILTLRSASVGKYKLYLSRQRNIRVDPFGDKELNRCKSHWLQLSRTTEPSDNTGPTFNFEGGNGAIVSASGKRSRSRQKFKP